MLSYNDFFKKLTKESSFQFDPYLFQKRCFDHFILHKSFMLNAPTGSGKTWASIAPFLYCWYEWKLGRKHVSAYPKKLIYSLPLRALANSLYHDVKEKVGNNFPELGIIVSLQTGENRLDPFFEGDIIFTTIDQTISNLLGIPLSLSGNLSNINAGAVISSYLVFDEFHLLEPQKALSTTLVLLSKLKKIAPFCLMTATLSNSFLTKIANWLNAEKIDVSKKDYNEFSFVKSGAEKEVHTHSNFLDSDKILEHHQSKTIVILNTVDKCVSIFKALKKKCNKTTKLICLHSRFFNKDRTKKEKFLLNFFGKNSPSENVILMTTQIIEVGLDISCDVMLTEVSPINSFLQRIGRCARWKGKGKIHVYDCESTYLPYSKELCTKTLLTLKKVDNTSIDYFISQELIENILSEFEKTIFDKMHDEVESIWDDIVKSWQTGDKSYARLLIRDISSISVVLLPKNHKTTSLYHYDSISLNPYYLEKKVAESTAAQDSFDYEPVLLDLKENFVFDNESIEDFANKELAPIEITEIKFKNIVALNSEIVGYSNEYGLDFQSSSGVQSSKNLIEEKEKYNIHFDTYHEHINWMLEYFNECYWFQYPLKQIQENKYSKFDLIDLIYFMIKTHDYGKLNKVWQKIAVTYQENLVDKKISEYLAHTDFDPNLEIHLDYMNKTFVDLNVKRKPDHSGIGAFVAYLLLPSILGLTSKDKEGLSLIKIISTSILRHHSSFSKKIPSFEISEKAVEFYLEQIQETFSDFKLNDDILKLLIKFQGNTSQKFLISFERNKVYESFTYFIFVRILRLCDQHSFKKNPRIRG